MRKIFLLVLSCALVCGGNRVHAQVIPDTTLGGENSQMKSVNPQLERIEGGAVRGINLFHSFTQFDIGAGRAVYFANPTGIENIISRVTGSNSSQIFGTLGVSGNANLFLINPNGIIFGVNGKLDVSGAFIGSTASSVVFSDGVKFSAVNPQLPPLLTIKVPIGLQFEDASGRIRLEDARLQMLPDKTLALVGGNINLDGATILAPGGQVHLGGLQQPGMVTLNQDGSFAYPRGVQRGDVSITKGSNINVRALTGGNITINAANFHLTQGSRLRTGISLSQGTINNTAGNVEIDATGQVTITDTGTFIANSVLANALGKGGDININTDQDSDLNNLVVHIVVSKDLVKVKVEMLVSMLAPCF